MLVPAGPRQGSEKAPPPSRAFLRPRILLGNPISAYGPAGQATDISPLRVLMQDKDCAYGAGADRQACHEFPLMGALQKDESDRLRHIREDEKPPTGRHSSR